MPETFHAYIHNTDDALLIMQACRQGLLSRMSQRLTPQDRKDLGSGCVFVYDEHESQIRRWTDGRSWSPSRILGNVYHRPIR